MGFGLGVVLAAVDATLRAMRAAVLFLALLAAVPAAAQSLVADLRSRVEASGLGEELGVAVVDIHAERPVFQYRAERPRNPASNQKLLTAAAALGVLGPDFTMATAVYGAVDEEGAVPRLVIRGGGDPTLEIGDFYDLARRVADQGVTRVERVVVDASYFDDRLLPPAFEQQPREVAAFRAAIGALSVARNAYTLRILPGAAEGDPARVRLPGRGYFDLSSTMTTTASGAPRVVADQRAEDQPQLILRLRGTVPADVRGVSYRRRVGHPLYWAGHVFRESLVAAGIRVGEGVSLGERDGEPLLTRRRSPPLSEILPAMGKWSDNFTAEMVFRVLGAERHRPGRSEDAVAALRAYLEGAGLDLARFTAVNGSGLFDGNEVSPQLVADLLAHVYRDEGIRPSFLAHLAVGGVDGTLRRRLRDLPAPRIVRAKTGTLNDVIALSGYVLGPTAERVYAFSVLVNGARGRHGAARNLADDIVRALAAHLHR
jgi:D-alanyl-D-alanine carboxypeptidase/D-alanyl-D-alanine-endopeptidase (penicillin-binding protein 4)